jgi:hypothetical protein
MGEVTGTLRQARGLQWLDAQGGRVAITRPPTETDAADASDVDRPSPPPPPAPEVVFSAPTDDESDVPQSTSVRIQFSRDINPATLKDRVTVNYVLAEAQANGEPPTPDPNHYDYRAAQRVLEIRFRVPLERYRTVKVNLLAGITGTDRQPLAPWTLSFITGPP